MGGKSCVYPFVHRVCGPVSVPQWNRVTQDGFLFPGKNQGGVWAITNAGHDNEVAVCLTSSKGRFYHRAVPLCVGGREGMQPMWVLGSPKGYQLHDCQDTEWMPPFHPCSDLSGHLRLCGAPGQPFST